MFPCEIINCFENFKSLFPGKVDFQVDYSNPWHFDSKDYVPFNDASGLYIYTKPTYPDFKKSVPLKDNTSEIWYIGKSAGGIGGRVWAHVGKLYEPGTKVLCEPRFKYHDWHQSSNPQIISICDMIAQGKIIVYTIKITPYSFDPAVAEKYLLACYYKSMGSLPPLNSEI